RIGKRATRSKEASMNFVRHLPVALLLAAPLLGQPVVTNEARHDVSAPLRQLAAGAVTPKAGVIPKIHLVRRLPPLLTGKALLMQDTVLQTVAKRAPSVLDLGVFRGLGLSNYQITSSPP